MGWLLSWTECFQTSLTIEHHRNGINWVDWMSILKCWSMTHSETETYVIRASSRWNCKAAFIIILLILGLSHLSGECIIVVIEIDFFLGITLPRWNLSAGFRIPRSRIPRRSSRLSSGDDLVTSNTEGGSLSNLDQSIIPSFQQVKVDKIRRKVLGSN